MINIKATALCDSTGSGTSKSCWAPFVSMRHLPSLSNWSPWHCRCLWPPTTKGVPWGNGVTSDINTHTVREERQNRVWRTIVSWQLSVSIAEPLGAVQFERVFPNLAHVLILGCLGWMVIAAPCNWKYTVPCDYLIFGTVLAVFAQWSLLCPI